MRLPDGLPIVLDDSAAWIWLLAADGEEDVVSAIGELVGRDAQEIAADVTSFLKELVAQGLLKIDVTCQTTEQGSNEEEHHFHG